MLDTPPVAGAIEARLVVHRPRSATQLWDASIALVRAHWAPLVLLSALGVLAALPAALVRLLLREPGAGGILEFFLSMYEFVTGVVIGGALTITIADAWHGQACDIGRALRAALRRAPALVVTGAVSVTLMLVLAIFLIVPGLLVAARFFAVGTVVVLEGQGIGGAFRRSVRLSRGNMRRLLATVGVATFLSLAGYFPLQWFFEQRAVAPAMAALLTSVIYLPLVPFLAAVPVLAYFDIRVRQEGYDLELAANALD